MAAPWLRFCGDDSDDDSFDCTCHMCRCVHPMPPEAMLRRDWPLFWRRVRVLKCLDCGAIIDTK